METSQAAWLASDPRRLDEFLASLTDAEALALEHDWTFWARPNQLPPLGDWTTWLILAGRGFGKTRTGAEFVNAEIFEGRAGRVSLVGSTRGDARDVMVEGESGILACSPPWFYPHYEPSKRRITWPNGARATLFSAEEPEELRGPQSDLAWGDEVAKWRYQRETWDNLQFGLRLGLKPRQVVTTTPKPTPLLKEIIADPGTVITRGTTYENKANLAPRFLSHIIKRYEGTRLGRQELEGHLLEDVPGALWARSKLDQLRVRSAPTCERIVVGVDPPISSEEGADECGIVVDGKLGDHLYTLADLSAPQLTPNEWAAKAVLAYHTYKADCIVAEKNQGGEMVESVIRQVDINVPVKLVHASKGKAIRAEPVAALYEQNRAHHVGTFAELEDQMCVMTLNFDRKQQGSPDRLDAHVWAATELMLSSSVVPDGSIIHSTGTPSAFVRKQW